MIKGKQHEYFLQYECLT